MLSRRGGPRAGESRRVKKRKPTPPIVKLERNVRDWFRQQKPTPPIVKVKKDIDDWFKRQRMELDRKRRIYRAR